MRNIYDAELLELIPDSLRQDEDIQAMATAISIELQLISVLHQSVFIWSRLDELQEDLIDHLAVELRSPYYDTALSLNTKRAIVANTLNWYMRLGTPAAVEELITVVFGNGRIQEWWEYGGEPFHFRVLSENPTPNIFGNYYTRFLQLLETVKRKSAWLDSINIIRTLSAPQTLAAGISKHQKTVVAAAKRMGHDIDSNMILAEGISKHRRIEVNASRRKTTEIASGMIYAAGISSHKRTEVNTKEG